MSNEARFEKAYPYQKDVLALPVTDLDAAAAWYSRHFGMTEVERFDRPVPTVILERDGARIGFSINGGDRVAGWRRHPRDQYSRSQSAARIERRRRRKLARR